MGANKQVLDIIKNTKQSERDKILGIVKDAATGPSATQEGGEGIRPDSATALVTSPSQDNVIDIIKSVKEEGQIDKKFEEVFGPPLAPEPELSFFDKLVRSFERQGSGAIFEAEIQQAAGDVMIGGFIKGAQQIDRPYNAVRVGFHRALTTRAFEKPTHLPKGLLPSRGDLSFIKESAGIFKDQVIAFKDGLSAGFNQTEVREISEVFDEASFGPDAEAKLNNYFDSRPRLKFSKDAADLYVNIGTEILADAALAVGAFRVGKPVVRQVTKKAPIVARGLAKVTPKTFVRIHWDDIKLPADMVIQQGFGEWIEEAARLNTTLLGRQAGKPRLNDLLLNNLMRDVPPGTTAALSLSPGEKAIVASKVKGFTMLHEFDEEAAQSIINQLNRDRIDAIKRFGDIEDRILHKIDPKIEELDASLSIQESLPVPTATPQRMEELSRQLDAAYMTKEFLENQKDQIHTIVDSVEGRIKTVGQGILADPTGTQTARIVRTKYLDEYARVNSGKPFVRDEMDKIANTISNGRTKELGELTDDEFMAVFDFLDMAIKDPESFTALPRRLQPVPPFSDSMTPAWMWFHRQGAEPIWHQIDQADIAMTKMQQEALQKWEDAAELLSEDINKVFKDEDLQKRLFWYVNNGKIAGRDRTAYFDEVKRLGLSEERIAKELNMAEVYKEIVDDWGEMGIAQGKLSRDGSGAPRRLDDYVYHQFEDILVQHPDPKDEFMLRELARPFEFRANTKIDIPQFKRRIANKDEGLIEHLDTAFRATTRSEPWALKMEPAMKSAELMAELSGSAKIKGYTREWINIGIRGMPTSAELRFEPQVAWVGRNILEKGTSWLPQKYRFVTKERATKQILSGVRRAHLFGGLSFNVGSMAKQSVQGLQGTALVSSPRHSAWAFRAMTTEGGQELLGHATTRLGRIPFQSFDISKLSHIERAGLRGFTWLDQWPNVSKTYLESLHWSIVRDKAKIAKVKKFGFFDPWSNPGRSSKTLNRAINAGEFAKDVWIANFDTRLAQYSYRNFDMPRAFWGQWTKTLGQFSSWAANYYYSFLPELAKMAITGIGPGGIKLGRWERHALARHYMYNISVYSMGRVMGMDLAKIVPPVPQKAFPFFNLGGAAPVATTALGPSPTAQTFEGAIEWGLGQVNENKRQAGEGRSKFFRSLTFLPPVGLRNALQVLEGEKGLLELPFPAIKEKTGFKGQFRLRPPGAPTPRRPSLF